MLHNRVCIISPLLIIYYGQQSLEIYFRKIQPIVKQLNLLNQISGHMLLFFYAKKKIGTYNCSMKF